MTISFNLDFLPEPENIWSVSEQPLPLTEGDSFVVTATMKGQASWTGPAAKIYQGSSDKTTTLMSGSASVSGNVVTLPTISGLTGGRKYVVVITSTNQLTKRFQIDCQKDEGRL